MVFPPHQVEKPTYFTHPWMKPGHCFPALPLQPRQSPALLGKQFPISSFQPSPVPAALAYSLTPQQVSQGCGVHRQLATCKVSPTAKVWTQGVEGPDRKAMGFCAPLCQSVSPPCEREVLIQICWLKGPATPNWQLELSMQKSLAGCSAYQNKLKMRAALCWVLLRASWVTAPSLTQARYNCLHCSPTLHQWQAGIAAVAAETLVTRAVTAVKMKVELFLRKAVVGW